RAPKSALLAFNIAGIHHSDLVALVAEQGVALRAGQHCAQPLIQALGITGSLRASFAPYNCPEDVTTLVKAVNYALSILNDEDFA
ncbi:MAG: aminotransferase class V-fold PLP-dependent enzyme, partial [Enterobacterales bacterium]|nr:aminotransferase class V-fold PLP-dependent enzyme [Enterobacterales bacterium]